MKVTTASELLAKLKTHEALRDLINEGQVPAHDELTDVVIDAMLLQPNTLVVDIVEATTHDNDMVDSAIEGAFEMPAALFDALWSNLDDITDTQAVWQSLRVDASGAAVTTKKFVDYDQLLSELTAPLLDGDSTN